MSEQNPQVKSKIHQPLVKWPGGKRWFAHRFGHALQQVDFKRLVEPFGGGMALSLALSPTRVLVNDINPHIINLYQHVQKRRFKPLEINEPCSIRYYDLRKMFNENIVQNNFHTSESASVFFALNRLGFNGLCRFNKQGLYNVPFGRYKKIKCDFDWESYAALFTHWVFECQDYKKIELNENDLLFCDPPYDKAFTKYSSDSFSFSDQEQLAAWANKHQGPVILMNHPTPRIIHLYQNYGFELHYASAPRAISREASSRGEQTEIIATKNFSWNDVLKKI